MSGRLTGLVAAIASLLPLMAGCSFASPVPQVACSVVRLGPATDPVALLAGYRDACVVVVWDTVSSQDAIGADGGTGAPPALAEAARRAGLMTVCAIWVTPSLLPDDAGFIRRFGRLDPTAGTWGAEVLVPVSTTDVAAICARWTAAD